MKSSARATRSLAALVLWAASAGAAGAAGGRAVLPAALFTPPYAPAAARPAAEPVAAFALDRRPVTNAEFARFVTGAPAWSRDRAPALFRDPGYLAHWPSAAGPAPGDATRPVVNVSWFAARAYCAAAGGRLPGELEWEYAAAAGRATPDMRREPAVARELLAWYSAPAPERLAPVGAGEPNHWGLYDLHTLVWEWIDDLNAAVSADDGRAGRDRGQVCGGAAGPAADRTEYAAFQRFAFRSSLRGDYTGRSLGFRCAADLPGDSLYRLAATWTTDAGAPVTLGAFAGRPVVLTLLYTSCKASCPVVVEDLKRVQALLTPAERERTAFVVVSLDPARDTPARLAAFKAKISAARGWTFLHGSEAHLRELAAALGVRYRREGGEIVHTNAMTVLDASGAVARQTFGLRAPPDETLAALRRILGAD
jgi:cytochrome oxidase Cu insertion factor (SCO1/SenC/PrrC family)